MRGSTMRLPVLLILLIPMSAAAQQPAVTTWSFDTGHGRSSHGSTAVISVIGQDFATPAAGGNARAVPGILPVWMLPGLPLAVDESEPVPRAFVLEQNYPNPFNPVTTIQYEVPAGVSRQGGTVSLQVFDLLGRVVATLVNEPREPGVYSVTFDASRLASGAYICRLTTGALTATRRMLLLK
jgi:hypothetical protein